MASMFILAQAMPAWEPGGAAGVLRTIVSLVVVLGLIGLFGWLLRRGTFGSAGKKGPIAVERALPLGDRRSLVIVSIEGRRLLLGLTPAHVSLVTELTVPAVGFGDALDRSLADPPGPSR